mmetsp:Transcript_5197/g.10693  ORF Transcript_5197/g.10693 Transcript_5197/m.10693 type:complete len:121 (+) Transcript_5197:585-947(+)
MDDGRSELVRVSVLQEDTLTAGGRVGNEGTLMQELRALECDSVLVLVLGVVSGETWIVRSSGDSEAPQLADSRLLQEGKIAAPSDLNDLGQRLIERFKEDRLFFEGGAVFSVTGSTARVA